MRRVTINTEYLDGFVYTTPRIEPLREALSLQDPQTVSVTKAGEEEVFAEPAETQAVQPPGDPQTVGLAYFPTAEGYYDYRNNRYIYQYKDHLGNVRLSYAKNSGTNQIEVLDRNDYYAFGMNMYQQNSVYDAMGTPLNYKYNQKELQETGFYDYGWRQYMPDLGRWFGMDQLSEKFHMTSPYAYVMNNPAMLLDPDGRDAMLSPGTEEILNQYMVNTYWRQNSSLVPGYSGSAIFGFSGINAPTQYSSVLKYWTSSLTVGQQNFDFDFYGERNGQIHGDYASVVFTQMTLFNMNQWEADAKAFESKGFDWYSPGGKANWAFGAAATFSSIKGGVNAERMYGEGIRRGISSNYALRGRNLSLFGKMAATDASMPISSLAKWGGLAGKVSLGIGIGMDYIAYRNGTISGAKFGTNTSVGLWGLTGVGTVPAIFYFGAEAFAPGGFEGLMTGAQQGYEDTQGVLGPSWRPMPLAK